MFVGPGVSAVMTAFGKFIMYATELQPLWMGMLVSATVGIVLTLPISSAALCVMLDLSGLAAGAATAGCCAQMIGFAFMSFRENRWGGLVAQGLGTSMLQMPNILRNPRIWIPTILTSLITGPLSTLVFKLENIGRRGHGDMRTGRPAGDSDRDARRRHADVDRIALYASSCQRS